MEPRLVAAIDGENVSFGILEDGHVRLSTVSLFRTGDFPTFTDALQGYSRAHRLSTAGLPLGIAIAGVTRGDTISPVPPRPVTPDGTFLVVGTGPGLGMATLAADDDGTTRVIAGKGRMKKALEPVPIACAQQDHARLHGAAAAQRLRESRVPV